MITRLNSLGFNELVAEYEVTGSAATTITFDGLDINADGGYTIVAEFISTNITSYIEMYANSDTANANYGYRYCYTNTTILTTGSATDGTHIAYVTGTTVCLTTVDATFVNGFFCANTNAQIANTARSRMAFIKHNVSQTNITRLDFTCVTPSSIGIGSKIKIYRWKQGIKTLNSFAQGRLVWEHTVTGSAVSSVTATGLDILRDGSYKVVCGIVSAASTVNHVEIAINTDASNSNYSGRYIDSQTTVLSTNTSGAPRSIVSISSTSGQISFSTTDMSLVNGYACCNNNQMRYNTTAAFLHFIKHNVSQTNITRLDFTSAVASSIGVGSKFYIFRTN